MSRGTKLTVDFLKQINKRFTRFERVDENTLRSALDRPGNMKHYNPKSTPVQQAASLAYGLIKNHPFQDANKRTAEVAASEYLLENDLNGLPNKSDIREAHLEVAKGKMEHDQLAEIYKKHLK